MSSFSALQNEASSSKLILAKLEATKRLVGWSVFSGSVYVISNFDFPGLVSVEEDGSALTSQSSFALSASEYFHDKKNKKLYARMSDNSNPNGKFVALTFNNFYSDSGFKGPTDITSGDDVYWLPLISGTSEFGFSLDDQEVGAAVEGSGSIRFINDQNYWASRYDKWTWENRKVFIYQGSKDISLDQFKLLFRGTIVRRSWSPQSVSFSLKDLFFNLRQPIPTPNISEVAGARVADSDVNKKQRRVYGFLRGHIPTNVDQLFDGEFEGYPLTGTASVNSSTTTVTGTGSSFLSEVFPDDEIRFGTEGSFFGVESVTSDTSLTLSDNYDEQTLTGALIFIRPKRPKRYFNREYVLAHHPISEVSAEITNVTSNLRFELDTVAGLRPQQLLEINGEFRRILRISGNEIRLVQALQAVPSVGDTVTREAIENVYVGTRRLQPGRDYTTSVNTSPSTITIDALAEVNVAPTLRLRGTSVSFTTSSADVTGTGTFFTSDLEPGDFIRARGETDFFEVREVVDDTNLKLVSAATYTANVACEYKAPEYIDDRNVTITCDLYGRTENNTSSGDLIDQAPLIVEELLGDAYDATDIDSASFSDAAIQAPYRVGLAIPERERDKKETELRAVIGKLNRSILGSLIQNNDFKLEYSLIQPGKVTIARTFTESDTISFSVNTEADSIVSKVIVNYSFREKEFSTGEPSNLLKEYTTDIGQFLVKTNKELEIDTFLADAEDAERLAQRLAFIYEFSRSQIQLDTKLQGSLLQVNDTVIFEHQNLFERTASDQRAKVYGVLGVQKSARGSKLELYDLSGVYTRIANIMADESGNYSTAGDATRRIGGYITDNFGMQDNDPDTFGVNLIF